MTWDLGWAGQEKSIALGEKVRKTCAAQSDLESHVSTCRKFVDSLTALPDMFQNKSFTLDGLIAATGTDEKFILDLFLPTLFEQAQEEVGQGSTDEQGRMQCPGQLLLKHAFFQLKEVEDTMKHAESKHSKAQKRYAEYKTSLDSKTSKKRKAAEIACQSVLEKDEVEKDKLARRNQINRKRKSIKKIKKHRSEEHLPEAELLGVLCCLSECTSCMSSGL